MPAASVPYQPFPTEQSGGGGGTPMSVRATPANAGSQVSQAVEKAGDVGFGLAQKQQGMINETVMTQADADFATKVGQYKADYTSLTGMAAHDGFPQYQQNIRNSFQEIRANLPPAAQRGFDMMATRTMANHIADGATYATSQLKEANRDTYSSLANVNIQALLDPQVAANPERSQYHIDTIKYAAQAQVDQDHPGLKTDKKTGVVSFDESTDEGKSAKVQFNQRLDTYLSQAYVNRYDTLAKHDVFSAYGDYQKERDTIPKSAQVALDASFAPRIFDAHKQTALNNTVADSQRTHFYVLTNPNSKESIDTVLNNEGGLSPDGHAIYGIDKIAHPKEFARASELPENEGRKYAEDFYKNEYWDKRGIASLPQNTQNIVMDGVVNHSHEFGDKLVDAAKSGASPQQLVDMRRSEYQRLATENPAKYSQYLQGWNNRLDNLQVNTEGKKTYATNENGGPLTLADYYRTHSLDVLANGEKYAESQMPGDLAFKRSVRQSLENYMNKTISNESAQHMMDNRNIVKAINGEMTNGKPPETEGELRAIPGVSNLLDNAASRDPKFTESIPTMIAKMARRNETSNSANGYETLLRVLEPNDMDHPNRIASQDHLDRLLGRSDGTGINMKDYKDAKQNLESPDKWKKFLAKSMNDISSANGNVDGNGQKRAVEFYNAATELYQKKSKDGVPIPEMINPQSKDYIGISANYMPARAQQINDAAQNIRRQNPSSSQQMQIIAINPKTKERVLLQDGKWIPMQ